MNSPLVPRWAALREALLRSTRTLQAQRDFVALARGSELAKFGEPGALLAHLTSRTGDLDEKDRLLAALVRHGQSGEHGPVAMELLWLGLWPALDHIHTRLYGRYGEPRALVSAIATSFLTQVARMDLRLVTRVAATLVWNTERDAARERHSGWKLELLHEPFSEEHEEPVPPMEVVFPAEPAAMRALIGDDAPLAVEILLGNSLREASAHLGLNYDAARKRFYRLRARFERSRFAMTH